jgi:glutathione synthase
MIELLTQEGRQAIFAQRYIPEIVQGDKRIILVDGEPVAGLNRVPSEGEARSNMHAGGRPELSELTEREREICARIGPALKERDLIFVGIDVIGDYLTEINVTSPTGIREIKRFGGPDIAPMLWNAIERRKR